MMGMVVLVRPLTGEISAGHTVNEPTTAAWDEAEAWLTEDGTHGRLVLRLAPPNDSASFALSTNLAQVLAEGWTIRASERVEQGVLSS